ncbi:MAG: Txe/YoeB family addiction module toxin [Treponema sp.]|nr:Txe/YoeB family addiction module toxin [Treponema sp.]
MVFENAALEQYQQWTREDQRIFEKISSLIKEVSRTPFTGTGKPESLKGGLAGFWSRRITQEHRLVYKVEQDMITIASCKYHYERG